MSAVPSIVAAAALAIAAPAPPREAPVEEPPASDAAAPVADDAGDEDAATVEPATADPPADEPPAPRSRAVFRSAPPPEPAPRPGARTDHGPIGGYGDQFDLRGRPPKDGEDEVLAGSIVLPLGIIGAASSGVQLWLSMPGHCKERWGKLGNEPSDDQCKGVYAFSIVRVVHSSLMAAAGAVLLGIGLHRREKYKRWKRGTAALPRIDGWVDRDGAGLGFVLRF